MIRTAITTTIIIHIVVIVINKFMIYLVFLHEILFVRDMNGQSCSANERRDSIHRHL